MKIIYLLYFFSGELLVFITNCRSVLISGFKLFKVGDFFKDSDDLVSSVNNTWCLLVMNYLNWSFFWIKFLTALASYDLAPSNSFLSDFESEDWAS